MLDYSGVTGSLQKVNDVRSDGISCVNVKEAVLLGVVTLSIQTQRK